MTKEQQIKRLTGKIVIYINARFPVNVSSQQICLKLPEFAGDFLDFIDSQVLNNQAGIQGKEHDRPSVNKVKTDCRVIGLLQAERETANNKIIFFVCELLLILCTSYRLTELTGQDQPDQKYVTDDMNSLLQKIRLELEIQAIENCKQNQGDIFKQIITKIITSLIIKYGQNYRIIKNEKVKLLQKVIIQNRYLSEEQYLEIAYKNENSRKQFKAEVVGKIKNDEAFKKLEKMGQATSKFDENLRSYTIANYLKEINLQKGAHQLGKAQTNQNPIPNFRQMPLKQKQIQKSRTIYHSRRSVHLSKKPSSSRQQFVTYGSYGSFEKLESLDNSTQWSSTQNSQAYQRSQVKGKRGSYFTSNSAKDFNQMEIENFGRDEEQSFFVPETPKVLQNFPKKGLCGDRTINFVLQF